MDKSAYESKLEGGFKNLPLRENLTESLINNIGPTILVNKLYGFPSKVFWNIQTIIKRYQ